jgi:hypothetical protein
VLRAYQRAVLRRSIEPPLFPPKPLLLISFLSCVDRRLGLEFGQISQPIFFFDGGIYGYRPG